MNQHIRILVVEDDAPVRNLITTTLKTHNYSFTAANNGRAAIAMTTDQQPDIIPHHCHQRTERGQRQNRGTGRRCRRLPDQAVFGR